MNNIRIAIANNPGSYSDHWIDYCKNNGVDYKIVNPYDNDIVYQLSDCDGFLWHFYHYCPSDMNFAKQLLFSLQQSGKVVFPDFYTGWHFDDKLGQKYLFESNGVESAKAYAFYSKEEALTWAQKTSYPKVFKLRGGAGSYNVILVHSFKDAKKLIKQSFGKGFKSYDKRHHMIDITRDYFRGNVNIRSFLSALAQVFRNTQTDKMPLQREYSYFQDFIPNDGFDYRIEVCGNKCIAMIRYARKGDFRASGGHDDHFDKELIPADVIRFAFSITNKLHLQAAALDVVRHKDTGKLYLVEISYCYGVDQDEFDHGFWDNNATWHNEPFNGCDWMIEEVISEIKQKSFL